MAGATRRMIRDADDRLRRSVSLEDAERALSARLACRDRRNLMTLNWAMQVATRTEAGGGLGSEHGADPRARSIESRVFALSILKRDDRAVVRKFVKPVEPTDMDVDVSGQRHDA